MPAEETEFVGAVAAAIDRVVIRGHELAAEYAEKPPAVASLTAFPQLLEIAGIVLLSRPLAREEFARIIPYTPKNLVDGLIDNNIAEGVVTERDAVLVLTDQGRSVAEAFVHMQDTAIARVWSSVADDLTRVEKLLSPLVQRAQDIEPPQTPSTFRLYAEVVDRPSPAGRVLRLITAVRYWRMDAHSRAVAEAGLRPFEAHALNRLWDAHRGVERVGQGFAKPGTEGVVSLEERGLAVSGETTTDGINLREQIENETDRLTSPIYDPLDETSRAELLAALQALPG